MPRTKKQKKTDVSKNSRIRTRMNELKRKAADQKRVADHAEREAKDMEKRILEISRDPTTKLSEFELDGVEHAITTESKLSRCVELVRSARQLASMERDRTISIERQIAALTNRIAELNSMAVQCDDAESKQNFELYLFKLERELDDAVHERDQDDIIAEPIKPGTERKLVEDMMLENKALYEKVQRAEQSAQHYQTVLEQLRKDHQSAKSSLAKLSKSMQDTRKRMYDQEDQMQHAKSGKLETVEKQHQRCTEEFTRLQKQYDAMATKAQASQEAYERAAKRQTQLEEMVAFLKSEGANFNEKQKRLGDLLDKMEKAGKNKENGMWASFRSAMGVGNPNQAPAQDDVYEKYKKELQDARKLHMADQRRYETAVTNMIGLQREQEQVLRDNSRLRAAVSELKAIVTDKDQWLQECNDRRQQAEQEMLERFKQGVTDIRRRNKDEIQAMKKEHMEQVRKITKEYEDAISMLRKKGTQHEHELAHQKKACESRMNKLRDEIEKCGGDKLDASKSCTKSKQKLVKEHMEMMNSQQREFEKLLKSQSKAWESKLESQRKDLTNELHKANDKNKSIESMFRDRLKKQHESWMSDREKLVERMNHTFSTVDKRNADEREKLADESKQCHQEWAERFRDMQEQNEQQVDMLRKHYESSWKQKLEKIHAEHEKERQKHAEYVKRARQKLSELEKHRQQQHDKLKADADHTLHNLGESIASLRAKTSVDGLQTMHHHADTARKMSALQREVIRDREREALIGKKETYNALLKAATANDNGDIGPVLNRIYKEGKQRERADLADILRLRAVERRLKTELRKADRLRKYFTHQHERQHQQHHDDDSDPIARLNREAQTWSSLNRVRADALASKTDAALDALRHHQSHIRDMKELMPLADQLKKELDGMRVPELEPLRRRIDIEQNDLVKNMALRENEVIASNREATALRRELDILLNNEKNTASQLEAALKGDKNAAASVPELMKVDAERAVLREQEERLARSNRMMQTRAVGTGDFLNPQARTVTDKDGNVRLKDSVLQNPQDAVISNTTHALQELNRKRNVLVIAIGPADDRRSFGTQQVDALTHAMNHLKRVFDVWRNRANTLILRVVMVQKVPDQVYDVIKHMQLNSDSASSEEYRVNQCLNVYTCMSSLQQLTIHVDDNTKEDQIFADIKRHIETKYDNNTGTAFLFSLCIANQPHVGCFYMMPLLINPNLAQSSAPAEDWDILSGDMHAFIAPLIADNPVIKTDELYMGDKQSQEMLMRVSDAMCRLLGCEN